MYIMSSVPIDDIIRHQNPEFTVSNAVSKMAVFRHCGIKGIICLKLRAKVLARSYPVRVRWFRVRQIDIAVFWDDLGF